MRGAREVFIRVNSGLGNQMFQYAFGFALAKRTSSTLRLLIDSPMAFSRRPFQLQHFPISARVASNLSHAVLNRRIYRHLNRAHRYLPLVPPLFQETKKYRFDESVLRLEPPVLCEGFWQCPGYFLADRQEVQKEFRIAAPLSPHARHWQERIDGSEAIVIHVRRGDYSEAGSAFRVLDEAYYRKAYSCLMERLGSRKTSLFVFSDDPQWAHKVLGFLPRLELVSGDRSLEPIDEFALMVRGRHFILANSTYSWWAAFLGEKEGSSICLPRDWLLRDDMSTASLALPGWTPIDPR